MQRNGRHRERRHRKYPIVVKKKRKKRSQREDKTVTPPPSTIASPQEESGLEEEEFHQDRDTNDFNNISNASPPFLRLGAVPIMVMGNEFQGYIEEDGHNELPLAVEVALNPEEMEARLRQDVLREAVEADVMEIEEDT